MDPVLQRPTPPWGLLLVLLAGWAVCVRLFGPQWSLYEQYNYGWAVPFLCVYLLAQRWPDRPAPRPTTVASGMGLLLLACAFLWLPTRIIVEANLLWRVGSWAMALEFVGLTLGGLLLIGGKPWVRHFGFPVAFFLVAVPWPSQWEGFVVQGLMRLNTRIVVEILSLVGTPALQHGNVIEVGTGMVGVDEACSGIRSLQATLMMALFFGEHYRLAVRRRGWLVLAGVGIAMLCNVARTFTLVFVASRAGLEAMEKWHDPTGIAILLACFCTLWLVSLRLSSPRKEVVNPQRGWPKIPRGVAIGLGVWLALVELVNTAWFGWRDQARPDVQNWSVRWPEEKPVFREIKFSPRVLEQLRYQQGRSAAWSDEDGSVWQMFHFQWGPASNLTQRVQVNLAKGHRPEICLPGAGMEMVAERGTLKFDGPGMSLPFRAFEFADRGRRVFVYYCGWEDGTRGTSPELRENSASRLRAAWIGDRSIRQRVLEVAIWGKDSAREADESLQHLLDEIIQRPD